MSRYLVREALKVPSSQIQETCVGDARPDALGLQYVVKRNSELTAVDKSAIWDLWDANMRILMVGSSLGYDPPAKRDEIFHRLSRFILVYKSPLEEGEAQKLVAYSTFRFDREDEDNVVYCYELQVDEIMRGVGIGRKLMGCLESVAEAYGMDKVMLTVLKANEKAFRFYMQCGFKVDESSPSLYGEEVDYEILSKVVSGADL